MMKRLARRIEVMNKSVNKKELVQAIKRYEDASFCNVLSVFVGSNRNQTILVEFDGIGVSRYFITDLDAFMAAEHGFIDYMDLDAML